MNQNVEKYKNILNLPHHQSTVRPHLSMAARAAQFAPFATLHGHEDAILETQRLTEEQAELTEEEARLLNDQTAALKQRLADGERPDIAVVYFEADEKKEGGSYVTYAGRLRRIDDIAGVFVMTDDRRIKIKDISRIRVQGVPEAEDGY